MKIAIDADNTIFDTESAVFPELCEYFNLDINEILNDPDFDSYKIKELPGYEEWTRANWERLATSGKPIPDSIEIVNKLYDEGNEITILTARNLLEFKDPFQATKDQLDKYGYKYSVIAANVSNKAQYCLEHHIDIFIDDSKYKCSSITGDTIVLMPVQRCNSNYHGQGIKLNNWKEIKEYIDNIKASK